jgi:SAM-dependent methyltransferase
MDLSQTSARDIAADAQTRVRKKLEAKIYWDVVSERPKSLVGMLSKMISEPPYFMSVVRKNLHFGKPKPCPILTTDRIVLEHQIFDLYRRSDEFGTILFVGCDADTARYHELYFADRRFITLEPNEANRSFGAKEHIVGTMEEMGSHIPDGSLDLVLCNGVFGWGLDDKANCEKAFAAAHRALRHGGQLLVGWNDVPRRAPFPLENIASLSQFRKYTCPLYGSWRYLTDTVYRHTFDFYQK